MVGSVRVLGSGGNHVGSIKRASLRNFMQLVAVHFSSTSRFLDFTCTLISDRD